MNNIVAATTIPSKIWTTVGSAGTLSQADLAKVKLNQSIIQLGADIVAPPQPIAQPAGEASMSGPIIPNIQAVVRYNVTPVEGLFVAGALPFRYALKLRSRGHVTAKLIEVDIVSGEEKELVSFSSNTPDFQVQSALAAEPSAVMDFAAKAYYVEATLTASAIIAGNPAEISMIKVLPRRIVFGSPLEANAVEQE